MPKQAPKANLAATWADAVPLGKFLSERAERGTTKATLPSEAAPPSSPARAVRKSKKVPSQAELVTQSLKSFSFAMEAATENNKRFRKAETDTLNDLIAGRVVCLGRRANAYEFERLDPSFWIGSTVKWHTDAVVRGDEQFIDVRVSASPRIAPMQSTTRTGPGRPTKADVIRAAIADYSTVDPRLNRPPHERHRAYRSYISAQDYDPRNGGFGVKTFEKYENEFRNKNK